MFEHFEPMVSACLLANLIFEILRSPRMRGGTGVLLVEVDGEDRH